MKKRIWNLGIVLSLILAGNIYGQTAFDKGIQSPTAASLGEYANEPVSLYTGKISKSIPIHSLAAGSYNFQVGLSYNYNGFKVESIPGPLGLGWSLNAGGVITRTVQSVKDEEPGVGYLDEYARFQTIDSQDIMDVEDGTLDGKPDMFYFNVNGLTGKFFLDKYGNFQVDSQRKLKIQWDYPTTSNSRFTITDVDGTIYRFGVSQMVEKNQSKTVVISGGSQGTPTYTDPYISAWYLTDIETTDGEIIDFDYTVQNYSESNLTTPAFRDRKIYSEEIKPTTGSVMHSEIQSSDRRLRLIWLDEISHNGVTIKVNYTSRTDFTEEKAISSLEIKDGASVIKKYVFDTDYIGSSGENSRLILDKIDVFGINNAQIPGWDFEYQEESLSSALPAITSQAIDFWGYYNGQSGNSNASYKGIPEVYIYNSSTQTTSYATGMNLEPDHTFSDIGLLKKVILPTGGNVSYFYEPNTYSYISNDVTVLYDFEEINFSASYTPSSSTNPYTYGSTFSVTETGGMYFSVATTGFTSNDSAVSCELPSPIGGTTTFYGMARFKDITLPLGAATIVEVGSDCTLFLDEGEYEVYFDSYDPNYQGTMTLSIEGIDRVVVDQLNGPGHRIQKVKIHDGVTAVNDQEKIYEYKDSNNSSKSSGVLASELSTYFLHTFTLSGGSPQAISVRSSSSLFPLGSTQGEMMGYDEIKEKTIIGSTEFYTISEFSSPRDYSDEYSLNNYKLLQPTSHDYGRGQLIKQSYYNENDQVVSEKNITFNFVNTSGSAGTNPIIDTISPRIETRRLTQVYGVDYNPYTVEYNLPVWTRTTGTTDVSREGVTGGSVNLATSYLYNSTNQQPSSVTESISGQSKKTTYKYAYEEYSDMQTKNMLIQPYSVLLEDGSGNDLSKTWTEWTNDLPTNNASPWRVWKLWSWDGTGTAPATPSTSNAIKTAEVLAYDSYGNSLEIEDADDVKTKFYYGSNTSPFSQSMMFGSIGEYLLTGVQRVQGTDNCSSNCGTRPTGTDDLFTEAEYDSFGRVISVTDENEQTNSFSYDNLSRLESTQNANGVITSSMNYTYSASENGGIYLATDPNQVSTINYNAPFYETDFSSSSGWSSVSSYNTFNIPMAGENTVRMGSGGSYETMYRSLSSGDILAKIDFYPDNTTGGVPHIYLDHGGNRFAVLYRYASDKFQIQYRQNNGSYLYSSYLPLNAPPNQWYTIELQKVGGELTAWVYLKGGKRDSENTYTVDGFSASWNPNFQLTGNDSYYYAANLSIRTFTNAVSYLDGLGREVQSQIRTEDKVITTETLYNERGLPEITSRPIETTSTIAPGYYSSGLMGGNSFTPGDTLPSLAPVHTYYAPLLAVTNDEDYAYSQTEYEDSPLARVEKSTLPGTAFKLGSGKEATITYSLNTGTTETFATSAVSGLVGAKSWAQNTLTKTISEDPSGNKTITYANGWGQTIASGVDMDNNSKLERSTTDLVTEFAYDERGNLVLVEDPRGLQTKYWYNTLGQLIKKELPDQDEPNSYCYDDKGRLRFHRDPNHEANVTYYYSTPQYDYNYTKYDELDRPVETGVKEGLGSYVSACASYANNQTYPSSYHTPKVYYSYDGTDAYTGANNLNGRLTKVKYLESLGYMGVKVWGETWYSYNDLGLVEWIVQKVPGVTGDIKITYTYDELGRQTEMGYNVTNSSDDHYFWYEYDALGRLEYVYSDTDSNPSGRIKEAEYTNYSADGQVAQMKLGNGNIQTVDYTYTAQGWLDKMNAGTVSSSTNGDRFALDLDYADNGNITLQKWMQSSLSTTNSVQYAYTYDKANRLTAANYTNNNSSATDDNNNGYDISPITYDKNGNIASIIRKGVGYYAYPNNSITSTTISSGSNRMTSYGLQNGPTPMSTKTVTYDANGNILQNRFTNGVYDERNLMTSVKSGTTTIQFGYDADGNRVRKEVVSGIETTYIRGADGQTIAVYENGSRAFVNLLAGGQMLGTYDGNQRRYFLKDHLGTVRTTVDQSGNVDGYDDYFPFGLVMSGRSNNTSNPDDLYKFTGHERDDEAGLNLDYMMARNYDPVIGRFMQVDPVLEYASSYTYVGNNPLNLVDPTGMFSCNTNSEEDCASQYATYSENKHNALEAGFGGAFDLNTGMNQLAQNQTTRSGGNCPDGKPCPEDGKTSQGIGLSANAFTAVGVFFLYLDDVISLKKYNQGYRKGLVENYKLIGRNFSLFKDVPMSARTKPYTGLTSYGRGFAGTGTFLGALGVGYDLTQLRRGNISRGRFTYNTTVTGLSYGTAVLAGGPWGLAIGALGIAGNMGYQLFQDVRTSWSVQLGNYESTMRKGFLPGGLTY